MQEEPLVPVMVGELYQDMVHQFNYAIKAEANSELRIKLIEEEAEEFVVAVKERNLPDAIDALCDLLYVIYGAADVFHVELITLWASRTEVATEEIRWDRLEEELPDFKDEVKDVVQALKGDNWMVLKAALESLAEGCWMAGAEGLGYKLPPFFREVHRANMQKLTGPKREDGKQLKPPGWKPPRITAIIARVDNDKRPTCVPEDFFDSADHLQAKYVPHPDGSFYCSSCGGLLVDTAEDAYLTKEAETK